MYVLDVGENASAAAFLSKGCLYALESLFTVNSLGCQSKKGYFPSVVPLPTCRNVGC